MSADDLVWRKTIVFSSAVVYWTGVFIQARRVRRQIGRSPNVRPRGAKEKWLWMGWLLVILAWAGQPFLIQNNSLSRLLRFAPALSSSGFASFGVALIVAGYTGTLWCYVAMGNTWRIGISRTEETTLVTQGPYSTVRHPIYLFQIVMLAGAALVLPTILSLAIPVFHIICVLIKASDEEAYLLSVHGDTYRDYLSNTGRLFPKITGKRHST